MPRIEIRVPDLGMQTEEIKFGSWLKQPGEAVNAGEDLFEVEADKATVVCESEACGTFAKAAVPEGGLKQGDLIGYLDTE